MNMEQATFTSAKLTTTKKCGVRAAPPLYNTGGPALMLI